MAVHSISEVSDLEVVKFCTLFSWLIFFLFQQIDKVFNNIGADLLTGGESENKEDGLQNKQKRVRFFTVLLTFIFILYDFYKPEIFFVVEKYCLA